MILLMLIRLHANKANNDPNTTRHTVGNRSMWKKLKTKSDRNGKNESTQKEKKLSEFQKFVLFNGQQQWFISKLLITATGKKHNICVATVSSSHVGWNLDQTETLQLWLSQPAESVCILVPVSSLAVTFLNLSSDISQPSLQVSVERCIWAGMTRCPRAAAVMQHVLWHELLLLLLLRKDSSHGSCLSVWNCN